MTTRLTWAEYAARQFEPRPRRYPTPGALAQTLDPATRRSPALDLLDRALVTLMDPAGGYDALEVSLPPQEGKSQRVSRRFAAWLLDHDPGLRVAVVSYEQELAVRWGRDVKADVMAHHCPGGVSCDDRRCGGLHVPIRRDSTAAGRWETTHGGSMYCVGIGGGLTGRPVDVLIVDDPVKGRAEAESQRLRDTAWDWWENVALPRLAPGARVCLIMTRWHTDDLAGRIAARPGPLRWRRLVIPAIAADGDPLGRAPGEELVSVRGRAPGYFHHLAATMSRYVFSGIYQQAPTAAEGNFFRRPTFRYWRDMRPTADGRARVDLEGRPVALVDCWRFATVDVAGSTRTSADWTVISVWAVTPDGDLLLLDRARAQVATGDHFALAQPLRARWGWDVMYVEHGYFGSTLVSDARDAGWPVAEVRADTDKLTRAIPAAGRLHAGRVWFPAVTPPDPGGEQPWLDCWCDELAAFPNGTHDDQVDTFSYAARVVTMEWAPPQAPPRRGLPAHSEVYQAAAVAATGQSDLDIMGVPY